MGVPADYEGVDMFLHYGIRVMLWVGILALIYVIWDGLRPVI
jgi:hypothetical protein